MPVLCTKFVQGHAQFAKECLVPVTMSLVMHLYELHAHFALISSALVCVVLHPQDGEKRGMEKGQKWLKMGKNG